MKRRLLLAVIAIVLGLNLFSQVQDVSMTFSPYGEYVWWNSNTTLDQTTLWGARAGFSFGPLFELRGFYQQSKGNKATFRSPDWLLQANWMEGMTKSKFDLSRYGGELKVNLLSNRIFAPYLTLGGGVQQFLFALEDDIRLEPLDIKEEQLFASVGLGTKFNLSDRMVLSLEAKHTMFNVNDKSYYLCADCSMEPGETKRLGNWSAVASLDFYLGGTKADKNEVYDAYQKMFTDGFSGMKFVVEPGVTYIKLKDDDLFEEQYFVGASAGVDFSSLVGLRGFYYKATEEPGKLALKFNNKMEMYGANLIARLNQPRGIAPYLQLGGGYIKTSNKYVNHLDEVGSLSRPFAMGGLGIEIPLSRFVALYGSINALLTNEGSEDLASLEGPKQVKTDMMYQAGMRFNIGRTADGSAYYQRHTDWVATPEREYSNRQVNELRAEYERRVDDLNSDIERAVMNKDFDEVSRIENEKRMLEERYRRESAGKDAVIQLTEEDLSRIVTEAVRETRREAVAPDMSKPQIEPVPAARVDVEPMEPAEQMTPEGAEVTEDVEMTEAEKLAARIVKPVQPVELQGVDESKLDRQFDALSRVIEAQSEEIAALKENISEVTSGQAEMIANASRTTQSTAKASERNNNVNTKTKVVAPRDPLMRFSAVSVYGASDLGSKTYGNIGVRAHWRINDSRFEVMPEVYVAFGKKNGIGVSANVIYSLGDKYAPLRPYAGLGVGGFPGNKTVWGSNVIGGVAYDIGIGELFSDISIRNIFRQNQWTIGYRVSF